MNDDTIYRQAAIDAIDSFDVLDGYQDKLELKSKIEELPSAKNKAFEEMKAELYEREVQAKADKECYPDNEYLEGVFDGLHEASKLMSIALPTAGCEYWDTESNYCALYRPAAVPTAEPRKGKWIDGNKGKWNAVYCPKCSVCGTPFYGIETARYHYCPNCGARMEEE